MGLEGNFKELQRAMSHHQAKYGDTSNVIYDFEDAYNRIVESDNVAFTNFFTKKEADSSVIRNKATLRKDKDKLIKMIEPIVIKGDYSVSGYKEIDDFIEDVAEEVLGRSILSHAFEDNEISDIFCMAWDNIWVEKNGKNQRYVDKSGKPYKFRDEEHYERIVKRILNFDNKEVNQGDKRLVDSTFYEDRVQVTDKTISPKGYSMTIRKHNENHITLDQIIKSGTISPQIARLLGLLVTGEMNMIYAGITGSGKTTSIRAILDYFVAKSNKRMLTAEDTQELFPENPHTVELVTAKTGKKETEVTLRDLIVLSLRLKPKYIVVGEVRGPEAEAAVEAMATGHSTIFTMHGGDAWDIINRLITKYLMQMPELSIEVVERIVGNSVDYIAIQDDIPNIGRRLTSLKEVSYDFKNRTTRLVPIIEYDFSTKKFVQINKLSPDKTAFMMRRGISFEEASKHTRDSENEYIPSLEAYKEAQAMKQDEHMKKNNKEIEEEVL